MPPDYIDMHSLECGFRQQAQRLLELRAAEGKNACLVDVSFALIPDRSGLCASFICTFGDGSRVEIRSTAAADLLHASGVVH